MKFIIKLFKFLIILALLLLIGLYFFFDDLKRYAIKSAVNAVTENGKYLQENYSIKEINGTTFISNLKIKNPEYALSVKEVAIDMPFLFLLNNAIKLNIDSFNFKLMQGPKISIIGSTTANCWYGGKLKIDTKGIDLSLDGKKMLKIVGNFDSNKELNEIDLYDYLDNNSKGKVIFGITNYSHVHVQSIQLPYAGGMITAQPFDLNLRGPKLKKLDLDINNVQLGSIIKLDLFTIDSRFSGNVSVNPDQKTITFIKLKSTAPGKLKLKTGGIGDIDKVQDSPLGQALSMIGGNPITQVSRLTNLFEYSSIVIETQKIDGGKDNIKISIYGADQKLYDNRPMNVNVNLDIDLNSIIKSYLGSSGK